MIAADGPMMPSAPGNQRDRQDLWAITCYFDPFGDARRLENYRAFRAALRCPLITVELGYRQYTLRPEDAELLVQLPGRDLLWQKERLLNIALGYLPADCDKVAWLDADIVFARADWAAATSRALDDYRIVQPFSSVQQILPPHRSEAGSRVPVRGTRDDCFVRRMNSGHLPHRVFSEVGCSQEYRYAPGMAWAARREALQDGLYDALIAGCGDKAMASALYGHSEATAVTFEMTDVQRDHYLGWARRFHRRSGGEAGFVDGELFHYWHGRPGRRSHGRPYEGFSRFDFDPTVDLGLDRYGVWRWASDKRDLHEYCKRYLQYRALDCAALP